MAEREGFEPPIPLARDNGFQDRRFQPLSHLSVGSVGHTISQLHRGLLPKLIAIAPPEYSSKPHSQKPHVSINDAMPRCAG
jgi:hypothetical protein